MGSKISAVRIAEAQLFHAESISKIERECFSVPWSKPLIEEEITHPESIFLCAYYLGNFAGFATMRNICGEGHITNLAVSPKYRTLGIAFTLMEQLISRGEEKGIHDYTLEVRCSNNAAIALYEKLGFHTLGIRKKYYTDNNEDALIMWKYRGGRER